MVGNVIVVPAAGIDLPLIRPLAGVLVGTLLVSERRQWLTLCGIAAAAMWLAALGNRAAPVPGLALALVFAVEGWSVAWILKRVVQRFSLTSTPHMWALICTAGAVTAVSGAVVATALLPGDPWIAAWRGWWLAGANGMVIVVPLIVAASERPKVVWPVSPWRIAEVTIAFVAVVAVSAIVFSGVLGPAVPAYLLPFFFWSVFRFGVGGTAATLLVVTFIGLWNIADGRGPFVLLGGSMDVWLTRSQGALAIATASFLVLAATVAERRRIARENLDLLNALEKAIVEIKTLEGFIPICAWCHKVRDDEGFWTQIENYLHERTEATFSHSICPACTTHAHLEIDDHVPSASDPA